MYCLQFFTLYLTRMKLMEFYSYRPVVAQTIISEKIGETTLWPYFFQFFEFLEWGQCEDLMGSKCRVMGKNSISDEAKV